MERHLPNQITMLAAKHSAKRNGKPFQLSPVLSMIACMTLGPIIEDARFDSPNKPKNYHLHLASKSKMNKALLTILSNPGGVSSAIIVCENA